MYITQTPERVHVKGYKRDDCTVIAIGNALGISYDLARKILQVGVYSSEGFTFRKRNPLRKDQFIRINHVKDICQSLSVRRVLFQRFDESKRISLGEFAKSRNEGVYLALVDHHLAAVIDGKVVDAWDSRKRKMIAAYKIDIETAHERIYELAKFYRMANDKHFIKKSESELLNKAG